MKRKGSFRITGKFSMGNLVVYFSKAATMAMHLRLFGWLVGWLVGEGIPLRSLVGTRYGSVISGIRYGRYGSVISKIWAHRCFFGGWFLTVFASSFQGLLMKVEDLVGGQRFVMFWMRGPVGFLGLTPSHFARLSSITFEWSLCKISFRIARLGHVDSFIFHFHHYVRKVRCPCFKWHL